MHTYKYTHIYKNVSTSSMASVACSLSICDIMILAACKFAANINSEHATFGFLGAFQRLRIHHAKCMRAYVCVCYFVEPHMHRYVNEDTNMHRCIHIAMCERVLCLAS